MSETQSEEDYEVGECVICGATTELSCNDCGIFFCCEDHYNDLKHSCPHLQIQNSESEREFDEFVQLSAQISDSHKRQRSLSLQPKPISHQITSHLDQDQDEVSQSSKNSKRQVDKSSNISAQPSQAKKKKKKRKNSTSSRRTTYTPNTKYKNLFDTKSYRHSFAIGDANMAKRLDVPPRTFLERTETESQKKERIKKIQMFKVKTRILHHLAHQNYSRAKDYIQKIYHQSIVKIEEGDLSIQALVDDVIQDFLLFAKILLLCDESEKDRNVSSILDQLVEYLQNGINFDFPRIKESMNKSRDSQSSKSGRISGRTKTLKGFPYLLNDFRYFQKLLKIYSIIAALYHEIGDEIHCEANYKTLIMYIEKLFGINSLEASNCYFYIGIYYAEQKSFEKAIVSISKAKQIRIQLLGENHESVADCYNNIGLIYQMDNQLPQSKTELETAILIKEKVIGNNNFWCSKTFQQLGIVCLQLNDLSSALENFQRSYEIRKKLIKERKHPELIKISLLIIYTNRKIEEELNYNLTDKQQKYSLNRKFNQILWKIYPQLNRVPEKELTPSESFQSLPSDRTKQNQYYHSNAHRPQSTRSELPSHPELRHYINSRELPQYNVSYPGIVGMNVMTGIPNIPSSMYPPEINLNRNWGYFYNINSEQPILEKESISDEIVETPETLSLKDFIPEGFDKILKFHVEEIESYKVLLIAIFILSLSPIQMEGLNRLQVPDKGKDPLLIPIEFRKQLSQFQIQIMEESEISKIPPRFFLKDPEEPITKNNIQIPSVEIHKLRIIQTKQINQTDIGANKEGIIVEGNILNLLQAQTDFYSVIDESQIILLNNILSLDLPIGLFLKSISNTQLETYQKLVDDQEKELRFKESRKKEFNNLNLLFKFGRSNYSESFRRIQPRLDLEEIIEKYIKHCLSKEMIPYIVLELGQEFYQNLYQKTQLIPLAGLKELKKTLSEISDDKQQVIEKCESFRQILLEFIRTLNLKEIYQFMICNSFIMNISRENIDNFNTDLMAQNEFFQDDLQQTLTVDNTYTSANALFLSPIASQNASHLENSGLTTPCKQDNKINRIITMPEIGIDQIQHHIGQFQKDNQMYENPEFSMVTLGKKPIYKNQSKYNLPSQISENYSISNQSREREVYPETLQNSILENIFENGELIEKIRSNLSEEQFAFLCNHPSILTHFLIAQKPKSLKSQKGQIKLLIEKLD